MLSYAQVTDRRLSRDETRNKTASEEMGRALSKHIASSEHGARALHLHEIIAGANSKVRSGMVSHKPLMEAALAYLVDNHCGTVELLHARGSLKEGRQHAAKPTESVVQSLCSLISGGSVWGLNAGEWEFSPEQMARIIAAAESESSKLCFAFFDAVLVSAEAAKELRGVIRDRRRATDAAPWLYGDDESWNKVVHAESKMWFSPHELTRNKEWLRQRGMAMDSVRVLSMISDAARSLTNTCVPSRVYSGVDFCADACLLAFSGQHAF